AATVETGPDDRPLGEAARAGLELEDVRLQQDHVEKLRDTLRVFAETGTMIVSPPHSSGARPWLPSSCFTRSGFASDLSILLIATMIGTSAARAWLMVSTVCGMTPSSAATTSTTLSVTLAPRARMPVKASWPRVSRQF